LVWDNVFQKCGASYYYAQYRALTDYSQPSYWAIVEYRRPGNPTLEVSTLSPAQKANGLEYSAVTRMSAEMWHWRSSMPEGRYWSAFKDHPLFEIGLKKISGKWEIHELNSDLGTRPGTTGATLFDAGEYMRGKLSCEVFSKDAPKPQPGYVCPGTILHGDPGVGEVKTPKPLLVFVTGKLGERGEVLSIRLADAPNAPEYRIYTSELKPTQESCSRR